MALAVLWVVAFYSFGILLWALVTGYALLRRLWWSFQRPAFVHHEARLMRAMPIFFAVWVVCSLFWLPILFARLSRDIIREP